MVAASYSSTFPRGHACTAEGLKGACQPPTAATRPHLYAVVDRQDGEPNAGGSTADVSTDVADAPLGPVSAWLPCGNAAVTPAMLAYPAAAGGSANCAESPRHGVARLHVRLLGGFGVQRAGGTHPVSDWQRRSAKTLTKLLAAHPRHALHREQILDILWPGADLESALNSLGKALYAARHAFEPDLPPRKSSAYLRLTDAMVVLDTEHVVIDADRFEQLAETALRRGDIAAYRTALAAYGGEMLPEDRYADWCAERRSSLAELHLRMALGLAEALECGGVYNESAHLLREVLRQDPAREEVHRRLMRLYAEMGTPDQAVRQFQRCADVLRRELDLAPQRETVSLYHDVLASRIPENGSRHGRAGEPVALPRHIPAKPNVGGPFVGHDHVVQQLCKQLTRRSGAGPGLVLVSGEAGVGKTRLLDEFAARAGRQGAAVLCGGSGAHASRFACGPFAVALEGYAAARPQAERNELAHRYPALARFVPSLRLNSGMPVPAAGCRDYHIDLIPAIVRLLTDLARRQPVLVVLGDLDEADPFSLDLLRYLAHLGVQRQWLIAAAVREEEVEAGSRLWRMMDATMRERLCLKIELRCLSRLDCGQLVRAILPGGRVGDALVEHVYALSRGNPLFVWELVREMQQCGKLVLAEGDWQESPWVPTRAPARVRALTAMRVAAMEESVRCVLGLAAAAASAGAQEISLGELRTGAAALEPPVGNAALFQALDRALRTGVLEEQQSGYAFRYPLVRSALYEGLTRHRRDQLHAALAARSRKRPHRLAATSAG